MAHVQKKHTFAFCLWKCNVFCSDEDEAIILFVEINNLKFVLVKL